MVPNPANDFVPAPGQLVRVVGNCTNQLLGRVVEVVAVADGFATVRYRDDRPGEYVSTTGALGGLEPVPQESS